MCRDGAWGGGVGDGHWGLMGQRGGSWYLQRGSGAVWDRSAIPKLHHFPLLSAEALALLGPAWGCAEVFPLVGIRLGMATWVFSVLVMWGQRGPTGTKDTPQGSPPH